jgi:hypothetical protein
LPTGDAIIGRRAEVVLSEQFNFYSKEVSRPETGIIRKFASLEDAQAWAEQDPYEGYLTIHAQSKKLEIKFQEQ